MSTEFDRNLFPSLVRTSFAISLGAAHRTVEMMKDPQGSLMDIMTEAKALVTPPEDAGSSLPDKAMSLAGVWMKKGVGIVEECRVAGEKFTSE